MSHAKPLLNSILLNSQLDTRERELSCESKGERKRISTFETRDKYVKDHGTIIACWITACIDEDEGRFGGRGMRAEGEENIGREWVMIWSSGVSE